MSIEKFMASKVKEINYKKLNQLAHDIAKRNNKSVFYVKCSMIKNFLQYGIGYTDYLKGDYINLTKEQKNILEEINNYRNERTVELTKNTFIYAFSLANKLIIESLKNPK